MARFLRANLTIGDILKWEKNGQLVLTPKFQRRNVWKVAAKSFLIDTVIREYPMPKIFLRGTVNPKTRLAEYEVVDGQQRLRAIIDFHRGELSLSKKHNPLGDITFPRLPDSSQRKFLRYKLSTEIMQKATDEEVWKMFQRLNSNTLTVNKQEKRNSRYFGDFKQTAYQLAADEKALKAWRNLRVFSEQQIARMSEVELTSDVLLAIVDGISDITDLDNAYDRYDQDFPKQKTAEATFRKTLSFATDNLAEAVRETRFRNRTWFYSLMVAAADTFDGIDDGKGPGRTQSDSEIKKRMFALDSALRPVLLPPGLGELNEALSRQTSHIPPRKIRHEHFYAMLNLNQRDWSARWERLTAIPTV